MSNSLGTLFRVTSFGESHGECVGVVIDGCPAGVQLSRGRVQEELDRRRPSGQPGATSRREPDKARILSGVLEDHTTGAPICMLVENTNADSEAYARIADIPRPGHADYPAGVKYGGLNDPRGGGRFSGRITAGFVMAGAVAKAVLANVGVEVFAHTVQIGRVRVAEMGVESARASCRMNSLSCCDGTAAVAMEREIEEARADGDSVGGVIECVATGLPVGIGEPVFSTVDGEIARALFAIPAVKAVEFGGGFGLSAVRGSQANDPFAIEGDRVVTTKNDAGGILGGLTTGMPVVVRAAIKPTASVSLQQKSVNLKTLQDAELTISGRHDACIVPRAVVVVEAMVAVTLCDLGLQGGLISGCAK